MAPNDKVRNERTLGTLEATVEIQIPVPWGHIAGRAWGEPTGQRVLAVHGWMDNAGTFSKLFPLLDSSLYIVAIEMPGHGRSSHLPPGIPYHYIDFVASIRRVIRHLGWNKFWYIGHSMGGSLGFLYSSLYPDEVERFISLDQLKTITDESKECRFRFADGINAFLSLDKIQIQEMKSPKTFPYELIVHRLMEYTKHSNYPLTEEGAKALSVRGSRQVTDNEWTYNRDQRLMSSSVLRFTHCSYLDFIANLQTPLLVVLAIDPGPSESERVRGPARESYKRTSKQFKLIYLPGNHFLHLNNPKDLANEISQFLFQKIE